MFRETFIAEVHEKDDEYRNAVLQKVKERYLWSVQIRNHHLPRKSGHVGKTISSLKLREMTNASIVAVLRMSYCFPTMNSF
jgi:K+/H+ antiporter YhaU regulatory subunit KhtT